MIVRGNMGHLLTLDTSGCLCGTRPSGFSLGGPWLLRRVPTGHESLELWSAQSLVLGCETKTTEFSSPQTPPKFWRADFSAAPKGVPVRWAPSLWEDPARRPLVLDRVTVWAGVGPVSLWDFAQNLGSPSPPGLNADVLLSHLAR